MSVMFAQTPAAFEETLKIFKTYFGGKLIGPTDAGCKEALMARML